MQLHDLKAPEGANKKRKRVGRGESSGHGKTAGRGGKGQTARTGKGKPGHGFEGGQMPMYRRMPKRGFNNIFAKPTVEVNIDVLAAHFAAGAVVDLAALREAGLATRKIVVFRVLGRGDLPHALTVKADHITAGAKEKIQKAGGTVTELGATESV
jgi:large subunit ribosomal protein L15